MLLRIFFLICALINFTGRFCSCCEISCAERPSPKVTRLFCQWLNLSSKRGESLRLDLLLFVAKRDRLSHR